MWVGEEEGVIIELGENSSTNDYNQNYNNRNHKNSRNKNEKRVLEMSLGERIGKDLGEEIDDTPH